MTDMNVSAKYYLSEINRKWCPDLPPPIAGPMAKFAPLFTWAIISFNQVVDSA